MIKFFQSNKLSQNLECSSKRYGVILVVLKYSWHFALMRVLCVPKGDTSLENLTLCYIFEVFTGI